MKPRKKVMIQMLTLARLYIESGRDRWVCIALLRARVVLGNVHDELIYLRRWIHNMMGRPSSPIFLEAWLVEKKFISQSQKSFMFSFSGRKKMIQTRLDWIEWMINDLRR
jgi:hypothetical protein